MKNVFKKLFSLMLVAVMLVSVLPMTAMADETDTYYISVARVTKDVGEAEGWKPGVNYDVYECTIAEGETVLLANVAGTEPAGVTGWTISTPAYAGQTFSWGMSFTREDFDENHYVGVYPVNTPEGGNEGGDQGEVTPPAPTSRDVKVEFKVNGTTILSKTMKAVSNDVKALTSADVAELFGTDATYQVPAGKVFNIDDNNACSVELEKIPSTAKSKTITLMGLDVNGNKVEVGNVTITEGKTVPALPTAGKSWKKEFTGKYRDDNSNDLTTGTKVDSLAAFSDVYYAVYNSVDTSKDGLSKLTVKASLYAGSKHQSTQELFSVILDDKTEILNWLITNNDRVNSTLASSSFTEGYERTKDFFYNYDGSGKLTEPDTLGNGDKTVYVKLNATEDKTAKVVLFIHTKVGDTHPDTEVITGYVKNGEITRDDVWAVVKKEYKTNSNTKLEGLYSKETWDQKVAGKKPTAVTSLNIGDKDYFEVHIILTNANASADSSNPKTGDSIFMTMTVMTVSVTALAVLVLTNKKRMVK